MSAKLWILPAALMMLASTARADAPADKMVDSWLSMKAPQQGVKLMGNRFAMPGPKSAVAGLPTTESGLSPLMLPKVSTMKRASAGMDGVPVYRWQTFRGPALLGKDAKGRAVVVKYSGHKGHFRDYHHGREHTYNRTNSIQLTKAKPLIPKAVGWAIPKKLRPGVERFMAKRMLNRAARAGRLIKASR